MQHATQRAPMGGFAGLMVPRQTLVAEPSHEEKALVWTLIIESGHIPFAWDL